MKPEQKAAMMRNQPTPDEPITRPLRLTTQCSVTEEAVYRSHGLALQHVQNSMEHEMGIALFRALRKFLPRMGTITLALLENRQYEDGDQMHVLTWQVREVEPYCERPCCQRYRFSYPWPYHRESLSAQPPVAHSGAGDLPAHVDEESAPDGRTPEP